MKTLNLNQIEIISGGLCVAGPGESGICMPCPAFLVMFEGNAGGFGGAPICIA